MGDTLAEIHDKIVVGDRDEVVRLVEVALEDQIEPDAVLDQGMISAMRLVGERFESGELYIPEMLIAARAMKAGLELLRPSLRMADVQPAGKVIMATVQGDLHDIGKNLVGMMLEGAGFEVIDVGVDVSAEKIVGVLREHQPCLLGLSALLTTTMQRMPDVLKAIREADLRNRVRVMIGGAPVTEQFAVQIGADSYSPDASNATRTARELMKSL